MFKIFTGFADQVEKEMNEFFLDDSFIKSINVTTDKDGLVIVVVHYGY